MTSIQWSDSVESTNTAIRESAFLHGDAIATLNQTAGRGRLGRVWHGVSGRGLAVSVGFDFRDRPPSGPLTMIPLLAGVALVDILDRYKPRVPLWIKWPNDVYLGELKVAGILTEMSEPGRLIVGLGVNVTHESHELPVNTATSLALNDIRVDATELATEWVARLTELVSKPAEADFITMISERMGLIGDGVSIELPNDTRLDGVMLGIDESGAVVVDVNGTTHTVVAGDVQRLRRSP